MCACVSVADQPDAAAAESDQKVQLLVKKCLVFAHSQTGTAHRLVGTVTPFFVEMAVAVGVELAVAVAVGGVVAVGVGV